MLNIELMIGNQHTSFIGDFLDLELMIKRGYTILSVKGA